MDCQLVKSGYSSVLVNVNNKQSNYLILDYRQESP